MSEKQRDDLDWLAFRYVAAELSGAESREFEDRLEHDQQAREAVGRVVEVTCAVRSLEPDVLPRVRLARRRRAWYPRRSVRWLAALALGLALAVLAWGPPHRARDGRPEGRLAGALPPGELALVWSSARTEWEPDSDADAWERGELSLASDRRSEASWDEPVVIDMPDWMILAVVAMESEPQDRNVPAGNPASDPTSDSSSDVEGT
jgi:hypothetical protein